MVIDLEDTSNHLTEVNISNWMVENKIAEWVTPVIPTTIVTLNDCSQHMQKLNLGPSLNGTLNSKEEKHNISIESRDTSENGSTNNICFESNKSYTKLDILKKYKRKLLNNSSGFSSPTDSSEGGSINDKEYIVDDSPRFN